jgi:ornithine carbamoyltransferase
MGEEAHFEERLRLLRPFQVNMDLMRATGNLDSGCLVFLHCLPAFHDRKTKVGEEIFLEHGLDGLEVTDEVFESEASIVFDQAENRMHSIKAIMVATLGD